MSGSTGEAWTGWESDGWDCTTTTPYVHWWESSATHRDASRPPEQRRRLQAQTLPEFPDRPGHEILAFTTSPFVVSGKKGYSDWLRDIGAQDPALGRTLGSNFTTQNRLPLPDRMLNPDYATTTNWFLPSLDAYPTPPSPGVPITGVIDTGIALSHRRFRDAAGKTRILAAWQQGAARLDTAEIDAMDPDAAAAARRQQDLLPFGRELLAQDIDALLERHAIPGAPFCLRQEAFWREAGLVDMTSPEGHRALMARDAHGTQVLDLAAGRTPGEDPLATRASSPIIAVNLPSRGPVGLSGAFLEYFLLFAIHRIVGLADVLWVRQRLESGNPTFGDRVEGYPIVINLSFGKQADARDGGALFAQIVKRLNQERASTTDAAGNRKPVQSKVHFVLPAGNDNLERGNAVMTLAPQQSRELMWRVLPEDRTPNYVEVFSDALDGAVPKPGAGPLGLEIGVLPPHVTEQDVGGAPSAGHRSAFRSLGAAARIYCDAAAVAGKAGADTHRVRYTLCAAPTWVSDPGAAMAPAGVWRLTLRNPTDKAQTVGLNVQTDQSLVPWSASGLRSYFDDPTYRVHDPVTGRALDSFDGKRPTDAADLVRRTGTLSALAHTPGVVVVAGHRASDGKPAIYSGTGAHDRSSGFTPTVSLPCDSSPMAPGILAAGSRDGSTTAPRGTSFAAAMATRMAVDILRWHPEHGFDLKLAFRAEVPDVQPPHFEPAAVAKVGEGRIPSPRTGHIGRQQETRPEKPEAPRAQAHLLS